MSSKNEKNDVPTIPDAYFEPIWDALEQHANWLMDFIDIENKIREELFYKIKKMKELDNRDSMPAVQE